ncbi:MAG: hypothetical protein ACM3NV_02795 [Syntrophothermus sp.]
MAIITMFEVHGDPDEIMEKMEAFEEEAAQAASERGGISRTIVKTDDGVMLVNHWESEEGMEDMAKFMRPKVEAAGIGPQVNWRMYEVLNHQAAGTL